MGLMSVGGKSDKNKMIVIRGSDGSGGSASITAYYYENYEVVDSKTFVYNQASGGVNFHFLKIQYVSNNWVVYSATERVFSVSASNPGDTGFKDNGASLGRWSYSNYINQYPLSVLLVK
ncbi:MAG: hypothetical protein ACI4KC_05350 [Gemmiger sp.]